jgi:hypothetical protein
MLLSGLPDHDAEEPSQGPDKVLEWRKDCLVRAGYDEEAAQLLAESECELHRAMALLGNGCSASLALLILL